MRYYRRGSQAGGTDPLPGACSVRYLGQPRHWWPDRRSTPVRSCPPTVVLWGGGSAWAPVRFAFSSWIRFSTWFSIWISTSISSVLVSVSTSTSTSSVLSVWVAAGVSPSFSILFSLAFSILFSMYLRGWVTVVVRVVSAGALPSSIGVCLVCARFCPVDQRPFSGQISHASSWSCLARSYTLRGSAIVVPDKNRGNILPASENRSVNYINGVILNFFSRLPPRSVYRSSWV